MSSIFISHSHKDNVWAKRIKTWLEKNKHRSLFLDFDPESGIDLGAKWEEILYAQLRQCQAVLVLISQNWIASKWCFAEAVQAREKGKKLLFAKIEECDSHKIFQDIQHVDFTTEVDDAFERLRIALSDIFEIKEGRSPYPGLAAFDEEDAAAFVGREQEIGETLEVLETMRRRRPTAENLLLVLGASGSGKSSLVRAGVLPRLRRERDRWLPLRTIIPDPDPFEALSVALADALKDSGAVVTFKKVLQKIKGEQGTVENEDPLAMLGAELRAQSGAAEAVVLVIIDQMEALLNNPDKDEVKRFFQMLRNTLECAGGRVMVIATMRSDFLNRFQNHPFLTTPNRLPYRHIILDLMPLDRFETVIRIPGERAKPPVIFKDDLVKRMLEETDTRHALPLLAYILNRMWNTPAFREDGRLELYEYKKLGGIKKALQMAADEALKTAGKTQGLQTQHTMAALRDAFVPGLVRVDADGMRTRRRTYSDNSTDDVVGLLEPFVDMRLLMTDTDSQKRETIEVTHEALLWNWPQLDNWIEDDQDKLRLFDSIQRAAKEWESGQDKNNLLVHRGSRLKESQAILDEPRFEREFSETDRSYLRHCNQMEKRAGNIRRATFMTIMVVCIVVSFMGLVLYKVETEKNRILIAQNEHNKAVELVNKISGSETFLPESYSALKEIALQSLSIRVQIVREIVRKKIGIDSRSINLPLDIAMRQAIGTNPDTFETVRNQVFFSECNPVPEELEPYLRCRTLHHLVSEADVDFIIDAHFIAQKKQFNNYVYYTCSESKTDATPVLPLLPSVISEEKRHVLVKKIIDKIKHSDEPAIWVELMTQLPVITNDEALAVTQLLAKNHHPKEELMLWINAHGDLSETHITEAIKLILIDFKNTHSSNLDEKILEISDFFEKAAAVNQALTETLILSEIENIYDKKESFWNDDYIAGMLTLLDQLPADLSKSAVKQLDRTLKEKLITSKVDIKLFQKIAPILEKIKIDTLDVLYKKYADLVLEQFSELLFDVDGYDYRDTLYFLRDKFTESNIHIFAERVLKIAEAMSQNTDKLTLQQAFEIWPATIRLLKNLDMDIDPMRLRRNIFPLSQSILLRKGQVPFRGLDLFFEMIKGNVELQLEASQNLIDWIKKEGNSWVHSDVLEAYAKIEGSLNESDSDALIDLLSPYFKRHWDSGYSRAGTILSTLNLNPGKKSVARAWRLLVAECLKGKVNGISLYLPFFDFLSKYDPGEDFEDLINLILDSYISGHSKHTIQTILRLIAFFPGVDDDSLYVLKEEIVQKASASRYGGWIALVKSNLPPETRKLIARSICDNALSDAKIDLLNLPSENPIVDIITGMSLSDRYTIKRLASIVARWPDVDEYERIRAGTYLLSVIRKDADDELVDAYLDIVGVNQESASALLDSYFEYMRKFSHRENFRNWWEFGLMLFKLKNFLKGESNYLTEAGILSINGIKSKFLGYAYPSKIITLLLEGDKKNVRQAGIFMLLSINVDRVKSDCLSIFHTVKPKDKTEIIDAMIETLSEYPNKVEDLRDFLLESDDLNSEIAFKWAFGIVSTLIDKNGTYVSSNIHEMLSHVGAKITKQQKYELASKFQSAHLQKEFKQLEIYALNLLALGGSFNSSDEAMMFKVLDTATILEYADRIPAIIGVISTDARVRLFKKVLDIWRVPINAERLDNNCYLIWRIDTCAELLTRIPGPINNQLLLDALKNPIANMEHIKKLSRRIADQNGLDFRDDYPALLSWAKKKGLHLDPLVEI